MQHRHVGERIIARLDRGEEVVKSLTDLCRDHRVGCASLSGIGAVRDAELGYYDLARLEYQKRRLPDVYELLSLVGNVALVDGSPFVHAHVALGDRSLSVVGGHLVAATVAVTAEIVIETMEEPISREMDEEVRLRLLRP